MGESNLNVYCHFCEEQHRPRYLCDPAKRILDAMIERDMSFKMPTIEFPEPLDGIEHQLGRNPGDRMINQFVVKAAIIPFAGTYKPAIILTGTTPYDEILPQWLLAGNAKDLRDNVQLVSDMSEMAIRRTNEIKYGGRHA